MLKTHVPSGFCLGSRAAPRATAPASPISVAAAAGRAKWSPGNQGDAAFPQIRTMHEDDGRTRAGHWRSRALRAVLKTHVPSGFCLGSRAAPRATAPASPISVAAAAGRAKWSPGNQGDAAFPQIRTMHGDDGRTRAGHWRSRVLRAVLKTHVPLGFCFGSRAAPRATAPPAPISLSAAALAGCRDCQSM